MLENARLIRQGHDPYRDFFLVTTPGSYYLQSFFGVNKLLYDRILYLVTAITIMILTSYFIKLSYRQKLLYLLSLSILLFIPGSFAYYNPVVTLIGMFTLASLYQTSDCSKPRWSFLSGFLVALAFFFKQSVGLCLGLASLISILSLSENRVKLVMYYLLGSLLSDDSSSNWSDQSDLP